MKRGNSTLASFTGHVDYPFVIILKDRNYSDQKKRVTEAIRDIDMLLLLLAHLFINPQEI